MFQTQTFYAPELGMDITVRGLSAAGVFRLRRVMTGNLPDKARNIAVMAEHIRDGLVAPKIRTNNALLSFIEERPELAARIFATVRRLTEAPGE